MYMLLLQDIVHQSCDTTTDAKDRPVMQVKVVDSGSLPIDFPFYVDKSAAIL